MDSKQHWEQIYARKPPCELSWHQDDPVTSLELIHSTGVGPAARIIDVGGGESLLVDRLVEQGFRRLAVLDVSSLALEHVRQRLGANAADVEWHDTDVTRFSPPHAYDIWHDRAVFHFLTESDERRKYVHILNEALAPEGSAIIAAFTLDGPQSCSDLEIVRYDAARLSAELGPGFVLKRQTAETHITPDGRHQKFSYYLFRCA